MLQRQTVPRASRSGRTMMIDMIDESFADRIDNPMVFCCCFQKRKKVSALTFPRRRTRTHVRSALTCRPGRRAALSSVHCGTRTDH